MNKNIFQLWPPPSLLIGGSWENCTTGQYLKLRWPAPTWPKLQLSRNEFYQGCPISGVCVDWATILKKGYPPPPIKACPPNPKFFGSLLNGHFCPPPLTATFPRALRTMSHYSYNIIVHRIRFYWIGEQYTSLCCWLIQMYIHKPFSLLPLEWTALLTVAWFAVSYRICFMARRLSF